MGGKWIITWSTGSRDLSFVAKQFLQKKNNNYLRNWMFSSLFISLDPAALLLLEGLVSVAKVVGVVAAVELVPVQHGLEAGASAVGARAEEG